MCFLYILNSQSIFKNSSLNILKPYRGTLIRTITNINFLRNAGDPLVYLHEVMRTSIKFNSEAFHGHVYPPISGHAGHSVNIAEGLDLRETPLDVQVVRHQRRRLHHEVRAQRDSSGHPRAHGQEAASS